MSFSRYNGHCRIVVSLGCLLLLFYALITVGNECQYPNDDMGLFVPAIPQVWVLTSCQVG